MKLRVNKVLERLIGSSVELYEFLMKAGLALTPVYGDYFLWKTMKDNEQTDPQRKWIYRMATVLTIVSKYGVFYELLR